MGTTPPYQGSGQGREEILDFIASAELAGERAIDVSVDEAEDDETSKLADATPQGAVVDSNVAAWPEGTPLRVKNAVAAWMLFAQRAASAKVTDKEDTVGWFDAYLDVLESTGWVLQAQRAAWQDENVFGTEVHQKILQFAAVVLGPVPGALALVTAALTSLQQMDAESKWIQLFDRRGKMATAVGFQLAHCEAGADGGAALNAADFRIHAGQTMTQVLFFKFTSREASMFYRNTDLALSQQALADYGPAIQERVSAISSKVIAAYPLEGIDDAN